MKLSDITLFDIANAKPYFTGNYKGFSVKITQVGKLSFIVTCGDKVTRVAGIQNIKSFLKRSVSAT